MKKEVFYVDEQVIKNNKQQALRLKETLEFNLERLDEFNSVRFIAPKQWVWDLTTYRGNNGFWIKKISEDQPLIGDEDLRKRATLLQEYVFLQKYEKKGNSLFYDNLEPLKKGNLMDFTNWEKYFIIDYDTNKVSVDQELEKVIAEENTIYIENEDQKKVAQSAAKILAEFSEIYKIIPDFNPSMFIRVAINYEDKGVSFDKSAFANSYIDFLK